MANYLISQSKSLKEWLSNKVKIKQVYSEFNGELIDKLNKEDHVFGQLSIEQAFYLQKSKPMYWHILSDEVGCPYKALPVVLNKYELYAIREKPV